jgi:hypothetical protein
LVVLWSSQVTWGKLFDVIDAYYICWDDLTTFTAMTTIALYNNPIYHASLSLSQSTIFIILTILALYCISVNNPK